MREITIGRAESGQRLDKYLRKYLRAATGGFIYKMLRKKNIKLNGKRAEGNEQLRENDVVTLYLAEDTISRFRGGTGEPEEYPVIDLPILYEDNDFIFLNKWAGVLSQRAKKDDISLVEYLLGYLQRKGAWVPGDTFTPAICNRLDRNTSGIVLAGKNLAAVQQLSALLKSRAIEKYYVTVAEGVLERPIELKGFLQKDGRKNRVVISDSGEEAAPVETHIQPICNNGEYTMLQIRLVTGKTHQIRAHLSSIGHPLMGDIKYGGRPYGKQRQQLLHALSVGFMKVPAYPNISETSFRAPLPGYFQKITEELFGKADSFYRR